MSIRLRIFIAAIVVIVLVMLIRMVKRKRLDMRDSLIWFFMCFIALVLDAFPALFDMLARLLGIEVPANMIFMFAIFWLIFTVFALSANMSRMAAKTRRLTQEVALLKKELSEAEGQDDKKDDLRA